MLAGVVERIAVLEAVAANLGANGVRRFGLQPALADVEHLVEHVRDMEPHGGSRLDIASGRHLFAREPPAVGKGELEFVAVELRTGRAEAGCDFGQLDLPDTRQLVANLRRLEGQLFGVGQVLPLAAAAYAEVLAKGFGTQRRAFHILDDVALHVAVPLRADLYIHHIARHGHRHEDHHVLPAPHGLAFGRERRYLQPLDQGVVCFLSCHISGIVRQR